MRIGVDLQTVGRGRTGDETYYRNLVSHYSTLRADYDFYLYYTDSNAESFFNGLQGNYHARKLAYQSPYLRIPLAYSRQMRREPVDVFHSQYVGFATGATKVVLTIHDLSYELYPETFPRSRALFLKLTRWSAHRADAIIVVSENTKKDLMRLYGIAESKIHVIYNAAHPRFVPSLTKTSALPLLQRLNIRKKYILSVGSLQPRKNITRLIKAYLQARTEQALDFQLVIVGKNMWGNPDWDREAGRSAYAEDIIFTGYVSDDALPVLYGAAEMFIYPSLYEGFGLPVLEAMACGVPVMTSDLSSLPEVGGSAVVYVDPYDINAMSREMVGLARDPQKRQALRIAGLERAGQFSWELAANKTLAVYESVMKGSGVIKSTAF